MYISDVHTYTYLCIIVHILICTVFLLPPCTSWLYVGINVCLFTCGNNFYCGKSSNLFSKGPKKTYAHTQYPPNINVNVTGYMQYIYITVCMQLVSILEVLLDSCMCIDLPAAQFPIPLICCHFHSHCCILRPVFSGILSNLEFFFILLSQ